MKLYDYYRSSASYRVRIALRLKGLAVETVSVNLKDGAQKDAAYTACNPQQLVPVLELDDGARLTQSLAIIDYLEAMYPEPPLLPSDMVARAHVRALAQLIACDIHPLNNLRVLQYLRGTLQVAEEQKTAWYHHWIHEGFRAFEARLTALDSGDYCLGGTPGLADLCLIPQVYNARRFDADLTPYPRIRRIEAACLAQDAFSKTAPEA